MTQKQEEEKFEVIDDGPSLHEILVTTPVLFLDGDTRAHSNFHLEKNNWTTVFIDGVIWNTPEDHSSIERFGNSFYPAILIIGHTIDHNRPFIALYNPQTRKGHLWYKAIGAAETLYGVNPTTVVEKEKAKERDNDLAMCKLALHSLARAEKINLVKDFIHLAPYSNSTKRFLFWFIAESHDLTEQICVMFKHADRRNIGLGIIGEISYATQGFVTLSHFVNKLLRVDVPEMFKNAVCSSCFFFTANIEHPEITLAFSPGDMRGPFRQINVTSELLAEINQISLS